MLFDSKIYILASLLYLLAIVRVPDQQLRCSVPARGHVICSRLVMVIAIYTPLN